MFLVSLSVIVMTQFFFFFGIKVIPMADNSILNVNGTSLDRLKVAMSLAQERRATGYAVEEGKIVFFWLNDPKAIPFPSPLSLDRAAEIAFEWLTTADYGPQPDHDGDNEKGWRCFTEGWGQIGGYGHASFVAVAPQWLMHGK